MFAYKTKIKFHEVDSAGKLFFAEFFKLAHDAYQAFLENAGLGLSFIINKADFILPIVHSEADFKKPVCLDDLIKIVLIVSRIGESSFSLSYNFNINNELVCTIKTVHAILDKKSKQKISIPLKLKSILEKGL